MKKILLSGAALALFATVFVSCGETKETKTETVETPTTTEAEKPAETAAAPASDAPTFSSEEVNKGLAEYKGMINEYMTALKDKDQAKLTELSTKAQEVGKNMQSWMTKLKPDETQKFTEYWQKLSQEWAAAATAATK